MRKKTLVVVFLGAFGGGTGCDPASGVKPTSDTQPLPQMILTPQEEPPLKDASAYAKRAYEWLCKDEYDKSLKDYDQAIRLEPDRASYRNSRGFTWHMKSIHDKDRVACEELALADYAAAIHLTPDYASAINNCAWLLATTKADRCRNGKLAVDEATIACELSGWKAPGYLDTLSCAYAEIGDFEQGIRWQQKALEDPSYQKEEGENAQIKLALFRKKQPFRE